MTTTDHGLAPSRTSSNQASMASLAPNFSVDAGDAHEIGDYKKPRHLAFKRLFSSYSDTCPALVLVAVPFSSPSVV